MKLTACSASFALLAVLMPASVAADEPIRVRELSIGSLVRAERLATPVPVRRSEGRCSTERPSAETVLRVEREIRPWLELARGGAEDKAAVNTIEVALWVVHIGGEGRLTDKQIVNQLAVLNKAFKGAKIQFKLLDNTVTFLDAADLPEAFHVDPFDDELVATLKGQFQEDPSRYLNLWTADIQDDILGFATFPWNLEDHAGLDGVVVGYWTFPGGAAAPFNKGDTAVHEVGHWLGLYHTFEHHGEFLNGCAGPGDFVGDTPAEAGPAPSFGCPTRRNSCPSKGNDPVKNFMDYSNDSCMTTFSPGQRKRMPGMAAAFRPTA